MSIEAKVSKENSLQVRILNAFQERVKTYYRRSVVFMSKSKLFAHQAMHYIWNFNSGLLTLEENMDFRR